MTLTDSQRQEMLADVHRWLGWKDIEKDLTGYSESGLYGTTPSGRIAVSIPPLTLDLCAQLRKKLDAYQFGAFHERLTQSVFESDPDRLDDWSDAALALEATPDQYLSALAQTIMPEKWKK